MARYKPGMFISTTEGKMKVMKDKTSSPLPCSKCEITLCEHLYDKHPFRSCNNLIGKYCYLKKV